MVTELKTPEERLTRAEALQVAERCAELLKREFGATRVLVFGSAAGQMPWHDHSDLDLAVEGLTPQRYWKALRALHELAPRDLEVDLVPLENAYPEMRARILGEGKMADDPVLRLEGLVGDELAKLGRVVARAHAIKEQAHEPPTFIEMDSLARALHDFYTAVEKIFERIAVQFEDSVPASPRWHADLLFQMSRAREAKRPAVTDDQLWSRLDDYASFGIFFAMPMMLSLIGSERSRLCQVYRELWRCSGPNSTNSLQPCVQTSEYEPQRQAPDPDPERAQALWQSLRPAGCLNPGSQK